ncbi:MAG: Lrp/AsnC family transcriptional regulator [Candidatus Nanopelagicales bacterium]
MTPPVSLDDVDKALIRLLQSDGRASYADLAPQVGLSAPAVRQRVQRLVDAGVLQIVGVTDPLALGLPVMALVGVRVQGDARAVADALAEIDNVVYLVTTAGSFDLFAEVVCRDMDELFAVVNDRIRVVPGVSAAESFPYFGIHTHRFTWGVPE